MNGRRLIGPFLQFFVTFALLTGGVLFAIHEADERATAVEETADAVRRASVRGCLRNVQDRTEDIAEAQREARYFAIVADHAPSREIRHAALVARRGARRQERSLAARVPPARRPLKYRSLPPFTCARAYRGP